MNKKNAAIAVVALLLMQPLAPRAELPRACFTPQMRAEFWSRMHALMELPVGSASIERQVLDNIDRAQAEYTARSLEKRSPRWHEFLPTCPRAEPRGARAWSVERGAMIDCFHAGAAACYRSVEAFASARAEGHQQQCCYDADGQLLTVASNPQAAGTPDFSGTVVAPPDLEPLAPRQRALEVQKHRYQRLSATASHARNDVMPWLAFDGDAGRYHRYWPPNAGPIRVGGARAANATGPDASSPSLAGNDASSASIAMQPNDAVLLEVEPATVGVNVSLVTEAAGAADGAAPPTITMRARACVVSRRAGRLAFAPSEPTQQAFVSWRRLVATSQCPVTVVSLPER